MNKGLLIFAFASGLGVAHAQSIRGWDELETGSYSGVGCKYGEYTSSAGDARCWGAGRCINDRFLEVNWYQSWSCTYGGQVTVSGSSYLVWELDELGSFRIGMMADGRERVYYWPAPPITYSGWEEDDCNGKFVYSGGYSYSC